MYVMPDTFDKYLFVPSQTDWIFSSQVRGGAVNYSAQSKDWKERQTWGQNVPSYWERKNKGLLIPHTNFQQKESVQSIAPSYYYELRQPGNYLTEMWNYSHAMQTLAKFTSEVLHTVDTAYSDAMVQRSAANIANKGWDGLTFASELPDLKRMFTKTAKRMGRLHDDYRKGKYKKRLKGFGKDTYQDFNNLWLEGRYGWRTLAYDVRDLNEAIRDYDEKRRIWTERSGYSYSDVDNSSGTTSWNAVNLQWTQEDRTEHSVRGAVAADFKPARVTLDPVNTAWELVPYSFVVDWVINVGETLASTKLLMLANDVTASVGVKSVSTRTVTTVAEPKGTSEVTYNETYTCTNTLVRRYPTSISMRPSITGRLIDSKLVLDLIALTRGGKKPLRR